MNRRRTPLSPFVFAFILIFIALTLLKHRLKSHVPARREHQRSAAPRFQNESNSAKQPWTKSSCQTLNVICEATYFRDWQAPADHSCRTQLRNGYPVPDPQCTPGGINPSITADVLRDPQWRTGCIRNCQESEAAKHITYHWYGVKKPRVNSGDNQVCELDHLVPLELGGADGLGNIWPECGPNAAVLKDRYFKVKDRVENYLADEVRAGRMPLETAQHGIAADWTQYLDEANRYCASGGHC